MDFKKYASIIVCTAGICAAVWFAFRYLWSAAVPLLLALLVSSVISPAAGALAKKTGSSRKLWAIILLLILIVLTILITTLIGNRLFYELNNLASDMTDDTEQISGLANEISGWISKLSSHIPWFDSMRETGRFDEFLTAFDRTCEDMINKTIGELTTVIPSFAVSVIAGTPSFLLSLTVFLIAVFYFSTEPEKIAAALSRLFPESFRKRLPVIRQRMSKTLLRFMRACLLIMLITFIELYIGFLILGIDFALIIAAVTAIIDILPVLGTGTVLIPWAVFMFIMGNYGTGCGLLIIYGVVLIVRQLIEPKIVGKCIGLHPLLTLAAMFIGFKLIGIIGMILFPFACVIIKVWLEIRKDTPNTEEPVQA